jgi:hypothetical protein
LTSPPEPADRAGRRFRKTLARVIGVQIVTLLLLWLLQATFSG